MAEEADFQTHIRPLLSTFCLDCHDSATKKGELDLERFDSLAAIAAEPKVWVHVQQQIADGEMPPRKKPQFSPEQRAQFTAWLDRTLNDMALAKAGDPGPVSPTRIRHSLRIRILCTTGDDVMDLTTRPRMVQ